MNAMDPRVGVRRRLSRKGIGWALGAFALVSAQAAGALTVGNSQRYFPLGNDSTFLPQVTLDVLNFDAPIHEHVANEVYLRFPQVAVWSGIVMMASPNLEGGLPGAYGLLGGTVTVQSGTFNGGAIITNNLYSGSQSYELLFDGAFTVNTGPAWEPFVLGHAVQARFSANARADYQTPGSTTFTLGGASQLNQVGDGRIVIYNTDLINQGLVDLMGSGRIDQTLPDLPLGYGVPASIDAVLHRKAQGLVNAAQGQIRKSDGSGLSLIQGLDNAGVVRSYIGQLRLDNAVLRNGSTLDGVPVDNGWVVLGRAYTADPAVPAAGLDGVTFSGQVQVTDQLDVAGADLRNQGLLRVSPSATFSLQPGRVIRNDGDMDVQGRLQVAAGAALANGTSGLIRIGTGVDITLLDGTLHNQGRVELGTPGSLPADRQLRLDCSDCTPGSIGSSQVENAGGSFVIHPDAAVRVGLFVQTDGHLTIDGSLDSHGHVVEIDSGQLDGNGIINGDATFGFGAGVTVPAGGPALIRPGHSPGQLNIAGRATFRLGSELELQVDKDASGLLHADRLVAGSLSFLDGAQVVFDIGAGVSTEDVAGIQWIECGECSFGQVQYRLTGAGLEPGQTYQFMDFTDAQGLPLALTTAVPEPALWALWLLSLPLLRWRMTRAG